MAVSIALLAQQAQQLALVAAQAVLTIVQNYLPQLVRSTATELRLHSKQRDMPVVGATVLPLHGAQAEVDVVFSGLAVPAAQGLQPVMAPLATVPFAW
jgi:uncharacterized membrane protein